MLAQFSLAGLSDSIQDIGSGPDHTREIAWVVLMPRLPEGPGGTWLSGVACGLPIAKGRHALELAQPLDTLGIGFSTGDAGAPLHLTVDWKLARQSGFLQPTMPLTSCPVAAEFT